MKIRAPEVAFEFGPLVPDAEEGIGRMNVARLRRNTPNPRILWETETDASMVRVARGAMLREIASQAHKVGFNIEAIARGIKSQFADWSDDQIWSLALEFVFPATLASVDLRPHIEPREGRGRPAIFDARTFAVGRLMAAWQRSTGHAPGFGSESAFPKVVGALSEIPDFKVRSEDRVIAEMRLALKAERKKLASGRIRYEKRRAPWPN